MNKKIDKLQMQFIIVLLIQIAILALMYFWLEAEILYTAVILVINIAMDVYLLMSVRSSQEKFTVSTREVVDEVSNDAMLFGQIGLLAYNDEYIITWMSSLFEERGLNRLNKKLLSWLPEVDALIAGRQEFVDVKLDDRMYRISRADDQQILFFKDCTDTKEYEQLYEETQLVLGLINFDNYEEATQYEDEAAVSAINSAIRQPVSEWCRSMGLIQRRLKNDRYLLILNERTFANCLADHFSIMNTVRKASEELDSSITLSMAFARGSSDLKELDDTVVRLLDLAQSRGGDQVAIRKVGEEVKYYGGNTESQEKRSKVRVRIMANTLRDLILKSSNVIICGHKDADFDCVGAAMCMSRIVQSFDKPCCIIARTGGLEEKLNRAMGKYKEELTERHHFVSVMEADNQLQEDTLVIMVDHYNVNISNGQKLLEKAKKVAIFDHHRRVADLLVNPILVYIESGASSSVELVSEFIPYLGRIDINSIEATLMLTGMIVDTNHFKVRTGSRTFAAAGQLKMLGADPIEADQMLMGDYDEYLAKADLAAHVEKIGKILISHGGDKPVSRSLLSQVADSQISINGIEASFVIGKIGDHEVAVSARSNGNFNVQVIMEKMHGGGHMTAAALQRQDTTIEEVKQELIQVLKEAE